MKCPLKKRVTITKESDSTPRVSETSFGECEKEDCAGWVKNILINTETGQEADNSFCRRAIEGGLNG